MASQGIWIGIAIGVFFAGLGIGYAVFTNAYNPNAMFQNPQFMQTMFNDPQHMRAMMQNPLFAQQTLEHMKQNQQFSQDMMSSMMQDSQMSQQMMGMMMQNNQFMQGMMMDPQFQQNWMGPMMNNPQFMNQWMSTMMNNPNFQQQYMGPWMMMRDPQSMQNMRNQYSQQTDIESLAVATDKVSILAETWQYQSTKAYSPSVIKISAGTTVTWTNDDQVIHTITDLGNEFDSGFIQPDETWEHTFDAKGNYYYFCSIHPWMTGAVIVS